MGRPIPVGRTLPRASESAKLGVASLRPSVSGFTITTQDGLPGPDGDAPYTLFLNETTHSNTRFLRTNVLSARPDLKKYSSIRFQQDLKHHPDALGPGQDLVLVFMEALCLEPPLTIACSDHHLLAEGFPVQQGVVIEIPLLPPRERAGGKGFR
jgi:hypothetical protein